MRRWTGLIAALVLLLWLPAAVDAQNLGLRVVLQTAATTGNGTATDVSRATNGITIYCEGTGTTSGGVITIEESRDTATAGTWSTLTTVTASDITGGAVQAVHLTGVYIAVRARISSTITGGGSVTCELLAN